MNLYVNFRGKKPSVDALLQKRGLNTTSKNW
jgi:Zn-dependent oligopeptidase